VSTAAKQASSRRRITATTDIIAIIGTIATTGTIADGNARVSGSTTDAVMHRAGSTGLPVQPALFILKKGSHLQDLLFLHNQLGDCPS
jgi:hypothetical protein